MDVQDEHSDTGDESAAEALQLLYTRQCQYSDYLDELQRASQRYYFFAFAALVGALLTVYTGQQGQINAKTLLSVAYLGAGALLLFGLLTLQQLASLRVRNLRIDSRIAGLEHELEVRASIRRWETSDERNNLFQLGNDWAKASFVAFGNAVATCIYGHGCLFPDFNGPHYLLIPYFTFEVSMLLYGWIVLSRLEEGDHGEEEGDHGKLVSKELFGWLADHSRSQRARMLLSSRNTILGRTMWRLWQMAARSHVKLH